jgi:hypothetical protein
MFIKSFHDTSGIFWYYESIIIFNNTLIIAVLAFALSKIKILLGEVPQVA